MNELEKLSARVSDIEKVLGIENKITVDDVVAFGEVKYTTKRKHKKHMHMKMCELCGNLYKGNIGLGIHMAKHRKQRGYTKLQIVER